MDPAGGAAALALPGRPGRERELHRQRHRDPRLGHEHRARRGQRGPDPLRGRQEAVLGPAGLGRVEPADDLDRAVGDDPPLHLGRGLLGADEDDAERPAALGDVEHQLLDRRGALPRRVLVQLVDHGEQQPARPGRLLALGLRPQHHADHEPLPAVRQGVQVDDRDLLALGGHPVPPGARQVGPDQRPDRLERRAQPADERVDRAGADRRTGPLPPGVLVGDLGHDEVDQLVVGPQQRAVDASRRRRCRPARPSVRSRVATWWTTIVYWLRSSSTSANTYGSSSRCAELGDRPPERADPVGPAGHVRPAGHVARPRRGEERRPTERLGRQLQPLVLLARVVVVEPGVRRVQEQQVLALDREDQRLGVGGPAAEHAGAEQRVQQEQREAGLRRHPGDAADRHVRAAGAVEEVEVDVHRQAVPAEPDRHLALHPVEAQRPVPLLVHRPVDRRARPRRHVHLGLGPGGRDLGDLLHLGRQHAVGDQEHVGGELGALVPGGDLGDHAGDRHRPGAGHLPRGDDHVVELQVRLRARPPPGTSAGWRPRCRRSGPPHRRLPPRPPPRRAGTGIRYGVRRRPGGTLAERGRSGAGRHQPPPWPGRTG